MVTTMSSNFSMRRHLTDCSSTTLGSIKISWRCGASFSAVNSSTDISAYCVTFSWSTVKYLSDMMRLWMVAYSRLRSCDAYVIA